jgi:hypothetical protein
MAGFLLFLTFAQRLPAFIQILNQLVHPSIGKHRFKGRG